MSTPHERTSATRRTRRIVIPPSTAAPIAVRPDKPARPANDAIAARAYALYQARGAKDGHDLDDWLQAERELGSDA